MRAYPGIRTLIIPENIGVPGTSTQLPRFEIWKIVTWMPAERGSTGAKLEVGSISTLIITLLTRPKFRIHVAGTRKKSFGVKRTKYRFIVRFFLSTLECVLLTLFHSFDRQAQISFLLKPLRQGEIVILGMLMQARRNVDTLLMSDNTEACRGRDN